MDIKEYQERIAAIKPENILSGHVSEDTAYVVADYPYGFRLRCQMRYWVEWTKNGARICQQTSNPKRAGLVWNKPKKSTYSDLHVLYLNNNGHVTSWGISFEWSDKEHLDLWMAKFGHTLPSDPRIAESMKMARICFEARKYIKVTVGPCGSERQTDEEKEAITRQALALGARDLKAQEA